MADSKVTLWRWDNRMGVLGATTWYDTQHAPSMPEYIARPRADDDAREERLKRAERALSHITMRMWGSDAPHHPDIIKAFDNVSDRAWSTDRAWDHIGKMCESAARKAGDAEARAEKAERAALRLLAAPYGTQEWREAGDALSRLVAPNGIAAAHAALRDDPTPDDRKGEDGEGCERGEE